MEIPIPSVPAQDGFEGFARAVQISQDPNGFRFGFAEHLKASFAGLLRPSGGMRLEELIDDVFTVKILMADDPVLLFYAGVCGKSPEAAEKDPALGDMYNAIWTNYVTWLAREMTLSEESIRLSGNDPGNEFMARSLSVNAAARFLRYSIYQKIMWNIIDRIVPQIIDELTSKWLLADHDSTGDRPPSRGYGNPAMPPVAGGETYRKEAMRMRSESQKRWRRERERDAALKRRMLASRSDDERKKLAARRMNNLRDSAELSIGTPGREQYSVKSYWSILEKMVGEMAALNLKPEVTRKADAAAGEVRDSMRFTITVDNPVDLPGVVNSFFAKAGGFGICVVKVANFILNKTKTGYRGINTQWSLKPGADSLDLLGVEEIAELGGRAAAEGRVIYFEAQFHTAVSFMAKDAGTHDLYVDHRGLARRLDFLESELKTKGAGAHAGIVEEISQLKATLADSEKQIVNVQDTILGALLKPYAGEGISTGTLPKDTNPNTGNL